MVPALSACSGGAGEAGHTQRQSEFDLPLPDLHAATFAGMGGISGWYLLLIGLLICVGGFAFGLVSYMQLKKLPVHQAMRDVSELIYETCKAYLLQQGKFLLTLFAFIGAVIFVYFGFLNTSGGWGRVFIVLAFALIGMGNWTAWWYAPGGERSVAEVADQFAEMAVRSLSWAEAQPSAGGGVDQAVARLKADITLLENAISVQKNTI